jgi:hypothetical protein
MEAAVKTRAKRASKKKTKKPAAKPDVSASYNTFKEYGGQFYTGMKIGRSHKWNYDKGVWRETKVTPERWELNYSVVKRRAGHAPEGSGAAVGTAYHWFILSHQYVEKLNADDYITSMVGLKFKLAHKRPQGKWSITDATQRKHLVQILKDFIKEIEEEPIKTASIPLSFEYKGKKYEGIAIPVISSCTDGLCHQLDVTINKKHLGQVKYNKGKWKINDVSQSLTNIIGSIILDWYQ